MGFSIRQAIFEYRRYTLLPLHTAIWRWIKNRDVRYSLINQEDWQKYKTSDTIFLFGSGPSINDITGEQWEVIKAHDSFGMNYSFLTKFPTTYFYLGYEPSSNNILSQSFSEDIRVIYEKSLWLLPMKVLYRLTYPRTVPYFFPPNARIALFDFPQGIKLETDRPFKIEDFHHSLIYRGSMGLGIHLMDLLGYKNIVLMGVDLHTYRHFYDNFEVMKKEREETYKRDVSSQEGTFEDLLPQKDMKRRTMEDYYYAVNELYLQPKGANLYVGNQNNMLSPRIPLFPDFK